MIYRQPVLRPVGQRPVFRTQSLVVSGPVAQAPTPQVQQARTLVVDQRQSAFGQQRQGAAPPVASTEAQAAARDSVMRSKMDMLINHVRSLQNARERDMEVVHAALASRRDGGSAMAKAWTHFWTQALTVVATVVATYLAQKYLLRAFGEEKASKKAAKKATTAAMHQM